MMRLSRVPHASVSPDRLIVRHATVLRSPPRAGNSGSWIKRHDGCELKIWIFSCVAAAKSTWPSGHATKRYAWHELRPLASEYALLCSSTSFHDGTGHSSVGS